MEKSASATPSSCLSFTAHCWDAQQHIIRLCWPALWVGNVNQTQCKLTEANIDADVAFQCQWLAYLHCLGSNAQAEPAVTCSCFNANMSPAVSKVYLPIILIAISPLLDLQWPLLHLMCLGFATILTSLSEGPFPTWPKSTLVSCCFCVLNKHSSFAVAARTAASSTSKVSVRCQVIVDTNQRFFKYLETGQENGACSATVVT